MANLDQQAMLELQADAEAENWEMEDEVATADLGAVGAQMPAFAGPAFWNWYDQNEDRVVVRKRVLGFPIKVRVRHIRRFFEQIFGPRPGANAPG